MSLEQKLEGLTELTPAVCAELSVLVIDPNHYLRGIAADALRRLNVGLVTSESNTEAARELTQTAKPHVIVVDWSAGDMTGLDYIRTLRRGAQGVPRETPVILLASAVSHDEIIAARQAGMDELLLKPISVRALKMRLDEVVLRRRKFIDSANYIGPCRRRRQAADYFGPWRRLTDEPAETSTPKHDTKDETKLRSIVGKLTNYAVQDAEDTRSIIRGLYRLLESNRDAVTDMADDVLERVWASALRYVEGIGMTDSYDPEVMLRHFQSVAKILDMPEEARTHRIAVAQELERLVTKRLRAAASANAA